MPRKILSPEKFVDALKAEGCDISLPTYKSMILALTKIGVKRAVKSVSERLHGRDLGAQTVVVETLEDEDEIDFRKILRNSLDRHLNLTHALGRWFEDEAPKPEETLAK